jgi:hypothetical protein
VLARGVRLLAAELDAEAEPGTAFRQIDLQCSLAQGICIDAAALFFDADPGGVGNAMAHCRRAL